MKDQFKKYIDENRAEFDDLEPSLEVLQRIKFQMQPKVEQLPKRTVKLISYKWMIAASVLIVAAITFILFDKAEKVNTPETIFAATTGSKESPVILPKEDKVLNMEQKQQQSQLTAKNQMNKAVNVENNENLYMASLLNQLADSTSSSTRLNAILKIQKSEILNNSIIDHLANTLNNDENSNVRAAALNLLSNYASDNYVANTLKHSFAVQKDPIIQLGLINLIGNIEDKKIEDKLFALANDPTTMEAVKDEAYQVLLNQNKL